MATSLVSTGVQFPDSTIQTTAATASAPSATVFISSTIVASSTASVAFTGLSNSTYAYYVLEFTNLYFTSNDSLLIQLSSDNGASYATGGYNGTVVWGGAGVGQTAYTNASYIVIGGIAQQVGNTTTNTCAGFIEIHNAGVEGGIFTFNTGNKATNNVTSAQSGAGGLLSGAAWNAFKLQGLSYNIAGGRFYLYGVKNS
jgi:hypothetical protein